MFLASVTAIALSIIGFFLSLQGLWLMCRALWPNRVGRTMARCRSNRIVSLLLGIPVTFLVLGAASLIARRGGTPGQMVGWVIGGLFLIYAGIGMSGFVTFVGERLPSPGDDLRPWWTSVRGGFAVELAMLFPVVGWFVLFPLVVMLGAGAVTLSFFGGRREPDLRSALAAKRGFIVENRLADLPPLDRQESGV